MNRTSRWYDDNCSNPADCIRRDVERIIEQHKDRRLEDSDYLRIHNHRDPVGTGRSTGYIDPTSRVRYNLFRAAVTTCRATIGSTKPAIKFGTTNAAWSLMRRAKAREQAVRAVFDDNRVYDIFKEIFTDALLTSGPGAMKVYGEGGRVKIERVTPGELLVDRDQGYYRCPQDLYQIKPIEKDELYRLYPDKENVIDSASVGCAHDAFDWLPTWDVGVNQVLVTEAWHLPSRVDDSTWEGGYHIITATSGILLDREDYNYPEYPFAYYRWEKRSFGWPGMSLCEELRGHYETIAYLDNRIQEILYNLSRTKMFVAKGTVVDNITDDPRDVIEIDGAQPYQIYSPNVVPSELITIRRETIEDALRQIGVNEMTMTGTRPPGDWSGIALQELKDSSSQRFKDKLEDIERFYIDLGSAIVRCIEQMSDAGELKKFKVRVVRGSRYQTNEIDWSKNQMDADEYWVEANASSSLPQSSAGKMATIQAWQQMGWIDQQQARELMNLPDLESENSLYLAPYYEALDKIEDIVEDGRYTMPDGADDLETTLRLTIGSYNKFKRMNLQQDRLDMLLQLADDCQRLMEPSAPPEAAVAQPVGVEPAVPPTLSTPGLPAQPQIM
jgi:hypothetical protein